MVGISEHVSPDEVEDDDALLEDPEGGGTDPVAVETEVTIDPLAEEGDSLPDEPVPEELEPSPSGGYTSFSSSSQEYMSGK